MGNKHVGQIEKEKKNSMISIQEEEIKRLIDIDREIDITVGPG